MQIDLTVAEMKLLSLLLSVIEHSIAGGETELTNGDHSASQMRVSILGKLWVALCQAEEEGSSSDLPTPTDKIN